MAAIHSPVTVRKCWGEQITEYVVESEGRSSLADQLAAASDWVRDHPNTLVHDIRIDWFEENGETVSYMVLTVGASNPLRRETVTYR